MSINNNNNNNTTPSSVNPLLRIGLLGCANIAKKNAIAILQPSSACRVVAVASRSAEKAAAFRDDFLTPRMNSADDDDDGDDDKITCLGGETAYDDIIQLASVDALYIPLPTALHKEWVIKALSAGKHVLLEKPVALCATDYLEMLQAAQANQRFLQDGTMFIHHPRTPQFVQAARNTSVMGTLQRIEAVFSFCGDEAFLHNNIRTKKNGDPLGCLGDLGWYVLRLAILVVMGGNSPSTMMAKSAKVTDYRLNDDGVPIDATCLVKFQNQDNDNDKNGVVVLTFHCGFCTRFRQRVEVVGTKSSVAMDDFVLPKQHPVTYKEESMHLTEYDLITEHQCRDEEFTGPDVQEVFMWQTFARLAKAVGENGWVDESNPDCQEARQLSEISMANQKAVDALMTSIRNGGAEMDIVP